MEECLAQRMLIIFLIVTKHKNDYHPLVEKIYFNLTENMYVHAIVSSWFLWIIVRTKLNIACNLRVQICNYKCSTDLLCMYICMVSVFVLFIQLIMGRYRRDTHCLATENIQSMYS